MIGASTLQAQAGVPDPVQAALGDQLASLVFTPISPCRVVDTRGSGARAGIMAAGETRTFDLRAAGFTEGQGGQTACSQLPTFQFKAWAVNITAVGYSSPGHITVWPYNFPKPATSFMNFFPTAYAVANAGTVTGCGGCADSINVSVAASTHVIIDVMGYYGEATPFATGAMTDFAGTQVTGIVPGGAATAFGPDCPTGTVFVSGAVDTNSSAGNVVLAEQWRTAGLGMAPGSQEHLRQHHLQRHGVVEVHGRPVATREARIQAHRGAGAAPVGLTRCLHRAPRMPTVVSF